MTGAIHVNRTCFMLKFCLWDIYRNFLALCPKMLPKNLISMQNFHIQEKFSLMPRLFIKCGA